MSGENWLIVVAAGRGGRVGLPYNKVFHSVAGRSVLARCLDALAQPACYDGCVLVLSEGDLPLFEALVRDEGPFPLVRHVTVGGHSRQASVRNGLAQVPDTAKTVSIHDAARALVPESVLRDTLASAIKRGSGVAAALVTDTIKRVDGHDRAVETLDRSRLRAVQTPQAFCADWIREAHRRALNDGYEGTDDAALVEKYVGPVHLCVSSDGLRNIKLTTTEDLRMMESRLSGGMPRVGQGYDVHRLVDGRKCILCGVDVPHEKGLLGHSDADVATHALMDALLGACALGDIGRHFPDSDPQYAGADSVALLREVVRRIGEAGYAVGNADVTIVCERPKVGLHVEQMRANLAEAMRVSVDQVNVKATTTEGLGFPGRAEGIEAHAVAVVLPHSNLLQRIASTQPPSS